MNFGLERINQLLDMLGRPGEKSKIIHVAGTNGKGSVCAYISEVLRQSGHTVGRFNSPHLIEPCDSIHINGQSASQSSYDAAVQHIAQLNESRHIQASSFEQLVAVALYMFEKANLEFIILEAGLGGALDATNAIKRPVMTVITSIGMDHVHILGHTLEEIALAKAGIMKKDCPVVLSPQTEESILKVLVDHAHSVHAPCKVAPMAIEKDRNMYEVYSDDIHYIYSTQLNGKYQMMNSATAVITLDWMRKLGLIQLTGATLATGMAATEWPGRLEWIAQKEYPELSEYGLRELIVDGAHNIPAAIALRQYLNEYTPKRVIWIVGFTLGKDVKEILDILVASDDIVLSVPFTPPAGMPWIQCVDPVDILTNENGGNSSCNELRNALRQAGKLSNDDDMVVLCGSLYLLADFYRLIKYLIK